MFKRNFIRLFLKASPVFIAGLATVISASFMMSVLLKDIKILKTKAEASMLLGSMRKEIINRATIDMLS